MSLIHYPDDPDNLPDAPEDEFDDDPGFDEDDNFDEILPEADDRDYGDIFEEEDPTIP